jgi:hypothetical protein
MIGMVIAGMLGMIIAGMLGMIIAGMIGMIIAGMLDMIIAGMRHDFAIDSLIAASGFWSYYYRDNTNIRDIDLRLNSSGVISILTT